MCRLALFNKEGFELIEKKYGAVKFFDRLEKEFGGHGNGLAMTNGKGYAVKKGMALTSKEIVETLKNNNFTWAVYHTRLASIGSKTSKNCHPYREGDVILAMNGTERDFKVTADILNITDSEAILKSMVALDLPVIDTLKRLGSVFVGFDKAEPYVVSGSFRGNLKATKDDNGAIVFASSLPDEFEAYEPIKTPFVWTKETKFNDVLKREVKVKFDSKSRTHSWNESYIDRIWKEVREESDMSIQDEH